MLQVCLYLWGLWGNHPKICTWCCSVKCVTKSVGIFRAHCLKFESPKTYLNFKICMFFADNSRMKPDTANQKSALKTAYALLGSSLILCTLLHHEKVIDRSFDQPVFFYQRAMSEVPWPIAIILCHVLISECNLRNWARYLGPLPFKIWGSKTRKFCTRFWTCSRLYGE